VLGIAFGTVSYGNAQMRVLPPASELAGIRLAPSRDSRPPYSELLQSELTFTEPELLQLAADGLDYSYESFRSRRWGDYQTLILQRLSSGDLVRNIRMTSPNTIRFGEVLTANAAYRAAALAMPRDEEIYRIDTTYGNTYYDAAALRNLFELYREDRSKLSYEDLAGYLAPKAMAMPAPATGEDVELVLYKGDTVLDFQLYAEGMHKYSLFFDYYALTQKTPNAANAAMRFCNDQEQERMQKIQATLNSGVSIDWMDIRLQLCNIPTDEGSFNSEYINLRGLKDLEENAAVYEKKQGVLHIEEARALLSTLFSGDYATPDINKPFAQFNVNIEYSMENGSYTSQAMNTIYVMLDEQSMQTVLAMLPGQSPEEAALQSAVS
jgi:hypothetical protein